MSGAGNRPIATPSPAELAALAEAVAATAADLLVDGLGRRRSMVGTKSSTTDMVTEMDHASEALITSMLGEARPDDGVLGEEGTERPSRSGVRWVVDPLDGTTNYLYGHPGFAVSVAAEVDGAVVAGAVVDPLHGDRFTAHLGGGARRNGEPIAASAQRELTDALVSTGFSYDPDRRRREAQVLEHVLPRVRDLRRMGAAAVDLCWVACGRVDAFFEAGLAPWDFAAGGLVATEAGAVFSGFDGGPARPGSVVAAAPGLHAPLLALLAEAREATGTHQPIDVAHRAG